MRDGGAPRETILVTGAGGYLGLRLCERLLEGGDVDVIAWVHGAPDAPPPVPARLARFGARVTMAAGELDAADADDPFRGITADARARITRVVHGAAVTRFNVEAELADRVNVAGARRAFALAAACPNLRHLTYVSTVYAAGLAAGPVAEAPLPARPRFANHYERSKWEAEQVLARDFAHLPATIARVATVIADDDGGAVTQQNAVHNTLRLLFHGLLSLVPGEAATPVYFVTGELVVAALAAIARADAPPPVVHVSHDRAASATLGELLDVAFAIFEADAGYQRRRLLRPLLVDADSFELLVSGIDGFGGDAVRQALASVAPFARQLFATKDVHNDRLRALVPGYAAPPAAALVRATARHLVATRWGKVAA